MIILKIIAWLTFLVPIGIMIYGTFSVTKSTGSTLIVTVILAAITVTYLSGIGAI